MELSLYTIYLLTLLLINTIESYPYVRLKNFALMPWRSPKVLKFIERCKIQNETKIFLTSCQTIIATLIAVFLQSVR